MDVSENESEFRQPVVVSKRIQYFECFNPDDNTENSREVDLQKSAHKNYGNEHTTNKSKNFEKCFKKEVDVPPNNSKTKKLHGKEYENPTNKECSNSHNNIEKCSNTKVNEAELMQPKITEFHLIPRNKNKSKTRGQIYSTDQVCKDYCIVENKADVTMKKAEFIKLLSSNRSIGLNVSPNKTVVPSVNNKPETKQASRKKSVECITRIENESVTNDKCAQMEFELANTIKPDSPTNKSEDGNNLLKISNEPNMNTNNEDILKELPMSNSSQINKTDLNEPNSVHFNGLKENPKNMESLDRIDDSKIIISSNANSLDNEEICMDGNITPGGNELSLVTVKSTSKTNLMKIEEYDENLIHQFETEVYFQNDYKHGLLVEATRDNARAAMDMYIDAVCENSRGYDLDTENNYSRINENVRFFCFLVLGFVVNLMFSLIDFVTCISEKIRSFCIKYLFLYCIICILHFVSPLIK